MSEKERQKKDHQDKSKRSQAARKREERHGAPDHDVDDLADGGAGVRAKDPEKDSR